MGQAAHQAEQTSESHFSGQKELSFKASKQIRCALQPESTLSAGVKLPQYATPACKAGHPCILSGVD